MCASTASCTLRDKVTPGAFPTRSVPYEDMSQLVMIGNQAQTNLCPGSLHNRNKIRIRDFGEEFFDGCFNLSVMLPSCRESCRNVGMRSAESTTTCICM